MLTPTTNSAEALALAAMAATLTDERRAQRFLDLTGLDVAELRERALAGDHRLLGATIAFLESHEPDLIDVAGLVGASPAMLVAAREVLER